MQSSIAFVKTLRSFRNLFSVYVPIYKVYYYGIENSDLSLFE